MCACVGDLSVRAFLCVDRTKQSRGRFGSYNVCVCACVGGLSVCAFLCVDRTKQSRGHFGSYKVFVCVHVLVI